MLTELFETVRSGVAQVILERGGDRLTAGTAFLVDGGLVTNSHVVRAAPVDTIALRFADMDDADLVRMTQADVLSAISYESPASDWDVAVVSLDEPEFAGRHRFSYSDRDSVVVGEQVAFLGYPFQMKNLTCHVGYVSATFDNRGVGTVQLDASVNGGNSGGPLLDVEAGNVLGIVTRAHVGFVADQFEKLLATLQQNVQVLENQQAAIVVGGVDPIQAIRASQAAMLEIAGSLRASANVGIGYAFSATHVRDATRT